MRTFTNTTVDNIDLKTLTVISIDNNRVIVKDLDGSTHSFVGTVSDTALTVKLWSNEARNNIDYVYTIAA